MPFLKTGRLAGLRGLGSLGGGTGGPTGAGTQPEGLPLCSSGRCILKPCSCPEPQRGLTQAQVGDGLEVCEAAGLQDGLGQPQRERQQVSVETGKAGGHVGEKDPPTRVSVP